MCVYDYKYAYPWKTCLQCPLVCGVAVCLFFCCRVCGLSVGEGLGNFFWKVVLDGNERGKGSNLIVSDVLGNLVRREKLRVIGFSSLVEKQASPLCLLLIFGSRV